MTRYEAQNMPKLHSPFVREHDEDGNYVVIDEVNEGYEWVFEDDSVMAVEKLDGTNVSIIIEDGEIVEVWNRLNRIPYFSKRGAFIMKGLINSYCRGYMDELEDGQHFGELVGPSPKWNENKYDMDQRLWIPFSTYSREKLVYHSWGKYPKTYGSISRWFEEDLIPLFYAKMHGLKYETAKEEGYVEGVVFTHPDGRMAKLRRDMFPFFYEGDL